MKKDFFRSRTSAQIRELDFAGEVTNSLVQQILDIDYDEYLVIGRELISQEPNKFKKHARKVILPRAYSQKELMTQRVTPVQLREKAFNALYEQYHKTGKSPAYSGMVFRPAKGSVDQVPREISLVGSLEGIRLFAYSHQTPGVRISFRPYDSAKSVSEEGASFIGSVPSRTEGVSRHDVGLESIALVDNDFKYVIAQHLDSDHTCSDKRYAHELRFRIQGERERGKILSLCPHDIALYLEIVDNEWNKNKNLVPLVSSQIPLGTQSTVDFYKKLTNNVLIKDVYKTGKRAGRSYTRSLNQAEQEALLWGLVMKEGHDKTFFAREDIKSYDWSIE